jgi:hypothetical protein
MWDRDEVHLADLFQAKGREIVRTGNPDAEGKAREQPFWQSPSPRRETEGTGGKGTRKGGSRAIAMEVLGNHLPSSHLVAMMPKAKTTAANTPIMAA